MDDRASAGETVATAAPSHPSQDKATIARLTRELTAARSSHEVMARALAKAERELAESRAEMSRSEQMLSASAQQSAQMASALAANEAKLQEQTKAAEQASADAAMLAERLDALGEEAATLSHLLSMARRVGGAAVRALDPAHHITEDERAVEKWPWRIARVLLRRAGYADHPDRVRAQMLLGR